MTDEAILVYVTVPNEEEAARIGTEVVKQRLAACANIVPAIRAIYWWDGEVQEDGEALLLLKSRRELWGTLRSTIKSLHSYEVPAISLIPLERVDEPYLKWLLDETRAQ